MSEAVTHLIAIGLLNLLLAVSLYIGVRWFENTGWLSRGWFPLLVIANAAEASLIASSEVVGGLAAAVTLCDTMIVLVALWLLAHRDSSPKSSEPATRVNGQREATSDRWLLTDRGRRRAKS